MKKLNLLFLAIIAITVVGCKEKYPELPEGVYAEIVTNQGTAVAKLYYDATPLTVANFVSLAEGTNTMVDSSYLGKQFYNGVVFHRVIKDFMIQGGDPLGTGSGDPGYKFPDEIVDSLTHKSKGILSMANSGPNTNGSQFFITLKDTPWLNGRHTVFGEVVVGQDVIDSIGVAETGQRDKPKSEIKMLEVNILRKGKEAKNFKAADIFTDKLQQIKEEEEEKERKAEAKAKEIAANFEALKAKATKLESGLEILFVHKEENGQKPKPTDIVNINYAGYFTDGKAFDTNIREKAEELGIFNERRAADPRGYAPIPMPYSPDAQMIPGFKEGAQQMNIGDKAILFIPSHLGYGERGARAIPPNSDLVFELELVGIRDKAPGAAQ
ncbi:peptidylprolyl isomerase [Aquimarina spongiae]|uniref:peptidylprolyl isomerase n=1 Tax=Aquimarina spongiae TaxID=570521 RepID=A0A1M6D0Y4_9FLAO|nr:peptidylprolyl isomerase [Aquimarina spongiae]SHI66724.1 peptidylprolyl isomerase [Aquimarina spongiae]